MGGVKIKIKGPKISAPKIKVAAPKIKVKAPKIKVAKPKVKLKPVKLATAKQLAKSLKKVAMAPVQITAHGVKQVIGSKGTKEFDEKTRGSFSTIQKGELPNIKQVIASVNAVSPVNMTDKLIKQTGGIKAVKLLDKISGGTYSQSVRVGNLGGRAMVGEAIKKSDWVDAAVFALKVYAAAAAPGLADYAIQMAKDYALKELSKKMPGETAEALVALSSGEGIATIAEKKASKEALKASGKVLGKDAASYLKVGASYVTGDTESAIESAKTEAKTIAQQKFEDKMKLPFSTLSAIKNGKVPEYSDLKKQFTNELTKAPETLAKELKKIPDQIAAAPDKVTKEIYKSKEKLINEELKLRAVSSSKILKEGSKKLDDHKEKLIASAKDTDIKKASWDQSKKDMADAYDKAQQAKKENKPEAATLAEEFKAKEAKHENNSIALTEADKKSVELVLETEVIKEKTAKKVLSATKGNLGVRFDEGANVIANAQPLPEKMEKALAKVPKKGPIDHPLIRG
jgi:hypothetical protein